MKAVRLAVALLMVLAVITGGAGVAAADHGDSAETCGALHDGEADNSDGTEGDDDTDRAHDECHGDHEET